MAARDYGELDIEGAEVAALRGATELLRSARPALLLEVEERNLVIQGTCREELIGFVSDLGYRAVAGAAQPNVLFLPTVD